MDENKSQTNTLQENNMRVFWIGTTIVILVTTLLCCGIANDYYNYQRNFVDQFIEFDTGGPMADLAKFVGFYFAHLFLVIVVQILILLIFTYFIKRNIKISGIKMWIFWAFEVVVPFVVFLLRWRDKFINVVKWFI